jgi:hypothetical protein
MSDEQCHITDTVQVPRSCSFFKDCIRCTVETLYTAFIRLNAWFVGWNHTWVAFIVFVFSCVVKPNSRRRSLRYVSGIGPSRSYFWNGPGQIAESVNFKKGNYELAIKITDFYMNTYTYMYTYKYMYMLIYMCTCMYMYLFIYMCVCVYARTHVHVYIRSNNLIILTTMITHFLFYTMK